MLVALEYMLQLEPAALKASSCIISKHTNTPPARGRHAAGAAASASAGDPGLVRRTWERGRRQPTQSCGMGSFSGFFRLGRGSALAAAPSSAAYAPPS